MEGETSLVVTGATSFLGSALVRELLAEGHEVYGVVRPHSSNRGVLDELSARTSRSKERDVCGRLHIVEMELEDLDRIHEAIGKPCSVFFHFGWDGSGSENRKNAQVQQKNISGGIKALRGAKELGCLRFLFSGSQAEYGICQTVMREEAHCHPVSEYGKAKLEFGRQARELCGLWRERGESGMDFLHVRIFSVYGPGDHPWSLVNTCLDTFLNGGQMKLSACRQQWNFLYIDDLVKGLLALAFAKEPERGDGIYNLAGEGSRPLKAYVEELHRLCGGRGSCAYGAVPPNAEGEANLIPSIEKIKMRTGWKPEITWEEGIKRMLKKQETKEGRYREGAGKACILCGQPLEGTGLMELSGMPASAQDIPDEKTVEEDEGITLRLCQCRGCGLVQFDCEPVAYYRDVIRSGGYSTTMLTLRRRQYRHLIDAYHLEGKKFLEVGCGGGEFLDMLAGFPVKAYGVEHRPALAEKARKAGLSVTEGFTETEDTILGDEGPYDVFLSFNFLEHQPRPGVMLDCIRNNLAEDGMGLITVPSLEYILRYNGYYELLRDHIAYYTFDSLRRLLEDHGFDVLEEELVNRDTLSVIVRRAKGERRQGRQAPSCSPVEAEGLKESLVSIRQQMESLCARFAKEGKRLAIWGAGHQGFTLAATTVLKEHARYIIDSAPFKQGKFAPASHLPIIAPENFHKDPVQAILIVAPGYTEEIADTIRNRFGSDVAILALRSERVEEWL